MLRPDDVLALVQKFSKYLEHNYELIDIFEGNLWPYIDRDLCKQMSTQSYEQAVFRAMPINLLPKVVDKLTNIYQTSVIREVEGGTDSDKELLSWYAEKLDINNKMNCSNELFNFCKSSLLQPFVHMGQPYLRVIENYKFIVDSSDRVLPCHPTDVVIRAGKKNDKSMYWVFGTDGFYVMDSDGVKDIAEMAQYNNPLGINPIAPKLPFIYVNDSKYKLMPTQDTDILKIIKVLPVMMTDLNFAAMFQCFSMIYGINLDDAGIVFSPSAFLRFKTDLQSSDQKAEIGTIKPEVDYEQVLGLIQAELSMWLGTKGIRPGTVGTLTPDNFASGISKVIDEMDTYEARQKQVSIYTKVEAEFWDLLLNYLHPYWVQNKLIDNSQLWSGAQAQVKTTFAVQLPLQSRGVLVEDLRKEREAGFITRKRAIQKLNPQMTSEEVDALMEEIDEERSVKVDTAQETIQGATPYEEAQA